MLGNEIIDCVKSEFFLTTRKPLSYRKLAIKYGISRGTVHAVAIGKREVREEKKSTDGDTGPRLVPVHKCDFCRKVVNLEPCRVCLALDAQALQPNGVLVLKKAVSVSRNIEVEI